jgi:hypothetical protein
MSSDSSANPLAEYLAGRLSAEQLVAAVAAEYYRGAGNGKREAWRPIMDLVERMHPGVVELKSSDQRPGFDVRLAERPFPKRYESELRDAARRVLATLPASRFPLPDERPRKVGLLGRIVAAIRRVFRG